MKLAGVFLLCCLAMQSAFADDTNLTLTVDGITYSNVTFGTVTPASVKLRHSTGIASIPLEKLPADLQQRFGYDPQKAAAQRALEQTAQRMRIQRDAESAAKRAEAAPKQVEIEAFEADCRSKVLVGGRLMEKGGELKEIVGAIWEKRVDGTILDGNLTEDYLHVVPQIERLIVFNFFPTEAIGKVVKAHAIPTNPVDGMRAFYIGGKVPSFDEWKKLQTASRTQ
jgi:hypothetical protein